MCDLFSRQPESRFIVCYQRNSKPLKISFRRLTTKIWLIKMTDQHEQHSASNKPNELSNNGPGNFGPLSFEVAQFWLPKRLITGSTMQQFPFQNLWSLFLKIFMSWMCSEQTVPVQNEISSNYFEKKVDQAEHTKLTRYSLFRPHRPGIKDASNAAKPSAEWRCRWNHIRASISCPTAMRKCHLKMNSNS